jgi:hypothetical protein
MGLPVRDDLRHAHEQAWGALGRPDSSWTGAQRVELAGTVLRSLADTSPLPPWVPPSVGGGVIPQAPAAPPLAHDVVYRVGRHAATLTRAWYDEVIAGLAEWFGDTESAEVAYVELVALTAQVSAIRSFRRGTGTEVPPLPHPEDGPPTQRRAIHLERARLNWVPVAAPADERAAVVQAFTAVPDTNTRTWAMADAQYMPDAEMVHPDWTRGPLSRAQMELVAMTVSRSRECFY